MSAFLRLKLTDAQVSKPTPQPFCAVNIMEAVHSPGEGVKLLQKKKTFYPDWNKCFDSHLVQGRRMQVCVYMVLSYSSCVYCIVALVVCSCFIVKINVYKKVLKYFFSLCKLKQ